MLIRVVCVKPQTRGHIYGENPIKKGNIKMKKILALMLAALMLVACVACGNNNTNDTTDNTVTDAPETDAPATDAPETDAPETDAPETDAPAADAPVAENALEILNKVWASYADDDRFMVGGGFGDAMNFEGPGSIPTDDEEALATAQAYFVMSAEAVAMVDDMAHMMHGMNQNTFTAGVFSLKADADKDAFIASVTDSVKNNHWMCGSPEQFVVITLGDYIITAYGHAGVTEFSANTVPTFVNNVKACYENAEVVVEEALLAE